MPFNAQAFQEDIERRVEGAVRDELIQSCRVYSTLTRPEDKASCIRVMMQRMDQEVNEATRRAIMEACGQRCIGSSVIEKARRLQREAQDLDDLLRRLNQAHIGGGRLERKGDVIQGTYDRCYCGSVSATREPFSATYCHCSCGWYKRLFEAVLGKPVDVELLASVLQGDERCEFRIHIRDQE